MATEGITFHQKDLTVSSFAVFEEMRKNQELCDLTLTMGNITITAHQVVVAAGIPYFRSLFKGTGMEETMNDVVMEDLNSKAFESLINFAYTSRVHISTENAQSLLLAAEFLQLTGVKDACVEFISETLSVTNVMQIHSLALDFNILSLTERSDTYILQNFEELSKCEEFLSLSGPYLKAIISKDDLNVSSEEIVFEGVMRWVGSSPCDRKDILPELLTEVRMVHMATGYLVKRVASEELIKDSPLCNEHIEKVKKYHLLSKEDQHSLNLKTQPRTKIVSDIDRLIYAVCYTVDLEGYTISCCGDMTEAWKELSFWKTPWTRVPATTIANESLYMFHSKTALEFNLKTLEWKVLEHDQEHIERRAVLTHENVIYCFGGDSTPGNSALCFDTTTNKWMKKRRMNGYRYLFPAAASLKEFIYVTGGSNGVGAIHRSAEKYCPSTGEWDEIAPMRYPRVAHASTALNGKIYVCGGGNFQDNFLRSSEIYDPVTNLWQCISVLNAGRRRFSLFLHTGKIYALGGRTEDGWCTRTTEVYDPEDDQWKAGISVPQKFLLAVSTQMNAN